MTKHTLQWSIIVPTLTGWDGSLGRTWPGLQEAVQRVGGEIIVVFDTGSPSSPPPAGFDGVVISTGGGRGYAGACNEGARHAHGSMMLFLNDDVFVSPDLVVRLTELWPSDRTVGAFVPDIWSERLKRSEAGCLLTSRLGVLDTRQEALAGRDHVDYPCGAAVAIDRQILDRAGGWEELYAPGYWEDVDLGLMLRHMGLPVLAAPDIQVRHVHGASFDALGHERVRALYERNRAICSLKYASAQVLPLTALFLMVRAVKGVVTDPATVRGTWSAFRSMKTILGARRRVRSVVGKQRIDDDD